MMGLGKLRRLLYDRKVKQNHCAYRMGHVNHDRRFDIILQEFRTAGGLKHDYQTYKLYSYGSYC